MHLFLAQNTIVKMRQLDADNDFSRFVKIDFEYKFR